MRRAKGEGSVYKRERTKKGPDGERVVTRTVWVAVGPPELGPKGKMWRKPFESKTQSGAIAKRKAYVTAKARGRAVAKAAKGTLLAYLLVWIEEHSVGDATRKAYRGHIVNHIGPMIGKVKLTVLESTAGPQVVKDFLAELGKNPAISKATVVRIRATLSKALNCAVDSNLIAFNPCVQAKAPPAPSGKLAHKPLRPEDIPLFLKVAVEDRLWPLWALLLGTGMRMGEALKLRWEDVSLTGETVHVRGGKTETSDRVIPLPDWTLAALKDHQKVTGLKRGLVFTTYRSIGVGSTYAERVAAGASTGKPLSGRNVNTYFHKLLDLAGIEDRRPHDMRHTFANTVLAETGDLKITSELLGHGSVAITDAFYTSGSSKAKVAAIRRLDGWVTT